MRGSNLLFTTSWIILLAILTAIFLYSSLSLWRAYTGANDVLTSGYTLAQIAEQGGEQAAKAFRGRRVTASTCAMGYALMSIAIIWIPYRRGEKWAWWALFVSLTLSQFLSLGRAIPLATTAGTGAPAIVLAFVLLGLLAGAPRMFGDHATAHAKQN